MSDPSYMSAEARDLLNSFETSDLPATTAETVHAHRQNAKDAFLPRADRTVQRCGVDIRDVQIAGIPCLDIRPGGQDAEGTILYCFGGGYISGSAREDLIVSAELCAGTGARVIAVDYRLAPESPWPAAHEDAWAVYASLCDSGTRFALAGESAGGNLALTLMLRAAEENLAAAQAVLLLSPWCDLADGGESLQANDGRDPSLRRMDVDAASGLFVGEADRTRPEISPLNGDFGPELPPVMITTGTRDLLMSQCLELARRMRHAGQDVTLDVYDGMWHVFEFYDELPEARQSLSACSAFLKQHLA
jgi:acetyl esterase/lipase